MIVPRVEMSPSSTCILTCKAVHDGMQWDVRLNLKQFSRGSTAISQSLCEFVHSMNIGDVEMGAPVMIKGRKAELQNAIQGLIAHDLEVVQTNKGYLISNGWATIDASIDEDEDSIVFLSFATWNPVRWPSASRLVNRVKRILNGTLNHGSQA